MAYTLPTTITAAELLTVTKLNQQWIDNIAFLANPPACRVFHNANQSITNNTETALAFNSERFDTNSMHDTATNNGRITFNTAGVYVVTAHVQFSTQSDYRNVYTIIRLNGVTQIALQNVSGNGAVNVVPILSVATIYKMSAADYAEVLVFQDNGAGAARNAEPFSSRACEFAATWIGLG